MCCDWMGLGGRGHMTHWPDNPRQGPGGLRVPLPEGYQANYKLLTKKEEQHLAFCVGVGTKSRNSATFSDASNFVQPFLLGFLLLS